MKHKSIDKLMDMLGSFIKQDQLPLSKDTTIESLGLDSLDEVELLMLIENEIEIEIDQAEVYSCVSLDDLAILIDKKVSSK